MIAADTSSWIAFLDDQAGPDIDRLQLALQSRQLRMVPAVLTELLSGPRLPAEWAGLLAALPQADTTSGYWERAGLLRAAVLASGHKAALGDALIAQSCLDYDLPLLTRDRDFAAFASAGLRLIA